MKFVYRSWMLTWVCYAHNGVSRE